MKGLIREDIVVRFGRLTAADFRQAPRSLQPLAALVAEHENVSASIFYWSRISVNEGESWYSKLLM
jgi:hypothetical protein